MEQLCNSDICIMKPCRLEQHAYHMYDLKTVACQCIMLCLCWHVKASQKKKNHVQTSYRYDQWWSQNFKQEGQLT